MSGILDSKTRVFDTIVTLEGRRQIAQGKLRISHVSFTDGAAFYAADLASGSADAAQRIYLESCELPQDQIVFESDDSGRLAPFRAAAGGLQVRAGQLIKYDVVQSGTGSVVESMQLLSSSESLDGSNVLLDSSITSFQKQLLLGTRDALFEDDGFAASPQKLSFVISEKGPIARADAETAQLEHLESLFQDVRLSGLPNFKYLPPVNKRRSNSSNDSQTENELGNYRPASRVEKLTYPELAGELELIARSGGRQTITFDPTTRANRLIGQMFERLPSGLRKLDVIDFGTHSTGNKSTPTAHVFFAGRLLKDSLGTDVFVHIFTLVFE